MPKSFTLRDLPNEERPRERLVRLGAHALSVPELIQIILGRGTAGESVAVTAQHIITRFGNLTRLSEAGIAELTTIKGVGMAKACQIKAAFELGRRLSLQPPVGQKPCTGPAKVYRLVKSKLLDYAKERLYLIILNSRSEAVYEISVGTLTTNLAHPREAFAEAVKSRAAAVIFAHNHPSGNPAPSKEDLVMTKRLVEAGKILGIIVQDHLVVTKNSYFSFREHGLI